MLRQKILRKIYITTLIVFVLFVITSFTTNKSISNVKVEYQTNLSSIYLLDDNNYLLKVNISVTNNLEDNIPIIINNLKDNNKLYSGLKGLIPADTKINEWKLNDGILTIDFSDSLLNVNDELKEKVIESIVFSLINFNEINGVKITINKKPINKIINNLDNILTKDLGINKEYDITKKDNIKRVVLYYYEEKNNNKYYVPVTKYVNSNDDKIKIIIDNLKTNYLVKTNLLSYLNDKVDIENYEIINNIVTISFASIMDFDNENILEEVIYTLSNSIIESDIATQVIFMKDDQIIAVK